MHLFEGPDFGHYEENLGREEERDGRERVPAYVLEYHQHQAVQLNKNIF